MLIVVNYHYVRPVFDAPYPGIHGVTPEQLDAQLRLLGEAGEFVSAERVRKAIRGTAHLPRQAVLVTFDDGLREQFVHALPVLRRLGVPAVFFVNTHPIAHGAVSAVHQIHLLRSHVGSERFEELLDRAARARPGAVARRAASDGAAGRQYRYDTPADARLKYLLNFQLAREDRDALVRWCFRVVFGHDEASASARLYMDTTQIRELGEEGAVGTHGHEHVPLSQLSRSAVAHSVRESVELLTQWLGHRPYALSYPYGSYEACSREAAAGVADADVEFAFTMERAGNADLAHAFHLARFDCNDVPGGKCAGLAIADLFERVPVRQWHRPASTPAGQSLHTTSVAVAGR